MFEAKLEEEEKGAAIQPGQGKALTKRELSCANETKVLLVLLGL